MNQPEVATEPTPEVETKPTSKVETEPTKATEAKTKRKISSLKLSEKFTEITNKGKNINKQILSEYFKYRSPSFLVKDLYEDNQNKNDMIEKYLHESWIDLRNY